MARSSFSAVLLRNPEKAAHVLAVREQRLAELAAGAPRRSFEDPAEIQRTVDRYLRAFREEGRCRDCGRELTDPVSVERGIGPDCWAKRQAPTSGMSPLLLDETDEGGEF